MRSLDLFSCIGCQALGFERAGIETIAFCENDPWRRERLNERFPGKYVHDDVRTMRGEWGSSADIIIGGPPCQRTSVAAAIHGKRDGESLWPDMLRVCDLLRPSWIVVEQPPGNAAWEAEVTNDLRCSSYNVARSEFGACDLGAPYLRRRVFLVACSSLQRLEIAWASLASAIDATKRAADARGDWDADQLAALRVDARSAGEMDRTLSRVRRERITALGDSNPPHMAEAIGRAITGNL